MPHVGTVKQVLRCTYPSITLSISVLRHDNLCANAVHGAGSAGSFLYFIIAYFMDGLTISYRQVKGDAE